MQGAAEPRRSIPRPSSARRGTLPAPKVLRRAASQNFSPTAPSLSSKHDVTVCKTEKEEYVTAGCNAERIFGQSCAELMSFKPGNTSGARNGTRMVNDPRKMLEQHCLISKNCIGDQIDEPQRDDVGTGLTKIEECPESSANVKQFASAPLGHRPKSSRLIPPSSVIAPKLNKVTVKRNNLTGLQSGSLDLPAASSETSNIKSETLPNCVKKSELCNGPLLPPRRLSANDVSVGCPSLPASNPGLISSFGYIRRSSFSSMPSRISSTQSVNSLKTSSREDARVVQAKSCAAQSGASSSEPNKNSATRPPVGLSKSSSRSLRSISNSELGMLRDHQNHGDQRTVKQRQIKTPSASRYSSKENILDERSKDNVPLCSMLPDPCNSSHTTLKSFSSADELGVASISAAAQIARLDPSEKVGLNVNALSNESSSGKTLNDSVVLNESRHRSVTYSGSQNTINYAPNACSNSMPEAKTKKESSTSSPGNQFSSPRNILHYHSKPPPFERHEEQALHQCSVDDNFSQSTSCASGISIVASSELKTPASHLSKAPKGYSRLARLRRTPLAREASQDADDENDCEDDFPEASVNKPLVPDTVEMNSTTSVLQSALKPDEAITAEDSHLLDHNSCDGKQSTSDVDERTSGASRSNKTSHGIDAAKCHRFLEELVEPAVAIQGVNGSEVDHAIESNSVVRSEPFPNVAQLTKEPAEGQRNSKLIVFLGDENDQEISEDLEPSFIKNDGPLKSMPNTVKFSHAKLEIKGSGAANVFESIEDKENDIPVCDIQPMQPLRLVSFARSDPTLSLLSSMPLFGCRENLLLTERCGILEHESGKRIDGVSGCVTSESKTDDRRHWDYVNLSHVRSTHDNFPECYDGGSTLGQFKDGKYQCQEMMNASDDYDDGVVVCGSPENSDEDISVLSDEEVSHQFPPLGSNGDELGGFHCIDNTKHQNKRPYDTDSIPKDINGKKYSSAAASFLEEVGSVDNFRSNSFSLVSLPTFAPLSPWYQEIDSVRRKCETAEHSFMKPARSRVTFDESVSADMMGKKQTAHEMTSRVLTKSGKGSLTELEAIRGERLSNYCGKGMTPVATNQTLRSYGISRSISQSSDCIVRMPSFGRKTASIANNIGAIAEGTSFDKRATQDHLCYGSLGRRRLCLGRVAKHDLLALGKPTTIAEHGLFAEGSKLATSEATYMRLDTTLDPAEEDLPWHRNETFSGDVTETKNGGSLFKLSPALKSLSLRRVSIPTEPTSSVFAPSDAVNASKVDCDEIGFRNRADGARGLRASSRSFCSLPRGAWEAQQGGGVTSQQQRLPACTAAAAAGRHAVTRDDDATAAESLASGAGLILNGSSMSLGSSSSAYSSSEEHQAASEIHKLKKELESAQARVMSLSFQLSTNEHIVSAFEQSLSSMNQRLLQLAQANNQKDSELSERRSLIERLQWQSGALTTVNNLSSGSKRGATMQHHASCANFSSSLGGSDCHAPDTEQRKKHRKWLISIGKAFSRKKKTLVGELDAFCASPVHHGQHILEDCVQPLTEEDHKTLRRELSDGTDNLKQSACDARDVSALQQQLRDKDLKLTDVQLEALTAAHQLDQLRSSLRKMKSEMITLKADNERLQSGMSKKDGCHSTASSQSLAFSNFSDEFQCLDTPIYPDVFMTKAPCPERPKFTVSIRLSPSNEAYRQPNGATRHCEILIGRLSVSGETSWDALHKSVKCTFKEYLTRVDPEASLGLDESSIQDVHIGDVHWDGGLELPELLPCGYLVGDENNISVALQDGKNADLLAFESLIPKSLIDRYVALLVEHHRIILCGPSGTGKTYLARKLAEHVVAWRGEPDGPSTIATYNVDHKSSKELRQYLMNIVDQREDLSSASPPSVVILDGLEHVTSLADVFDGFLNTKNARSLYIIGTLSQTTLGSQLNSLELHHNFRWVLCSNHSEPIAGFLARYLRRRLVHEGVSSRSDWSCAEDWLELEAIVDWLPRVWERVNRFIEMHCSTDVTLGPRLFLSCPMSPGAVHVWFADLWNYSIVPYLLEAIREGVQTSPVGAAWEDPTDWIVDTCPWTDAALGSKLLRLRLDDLTCIPQTATASLLCVTGGSYAHESANKFSLLTADPLMNMLQKLQEAANFSNSQSIDSDVTSSESIDRLSADISTNCY